MTACQKSLFDKLVDGGVNYPQFAMVTLLRLAACSVPASQFSMVAPRLRTALRFACAVFRGCALRFAPCARHFSPSGLRCSQAHSRCSLLHWAHRRLLHPQFAMVVLLRPTACSTPLLIGLTTACFAHCARPSCAPLAAPPLSPSLGLLRAASFLNSQ